MARSCEPIDFNSNTKTSNQLTIDDAIPNSNYTNDRGMLTLQQIDVIELNFRNNIVADTKGNNLSNAVENFPTFYEDLNSVNASIFNATAREIAVDLDATILVNRIDSGRVITPFEFAEFITDNYFTPTAVATGLAGGRGQSKNWLNSINCWFSGPAGFYNKVLGGACDTIGKVYAGVALFDALQDGVKDALEALTKIKNIENILQAIIDKITVQNLINAVKGAVAGIIQKAIDCVKMAVMSFDPFLILGRGGPVPSYALGRTIENALLQKEKVLDTLTDDFSKTITTKIEKLIDYSVNLFANPSVEEIEYLMSRFCGFTSQVGLEIESLKEPLTKFEKRATTIRNTVQASSRVITAQAIESGRAVLSDPDRAEVINNTREDWADTGHMREWYDRDPNSQNNVEMITFESIMDDSNGKLWSSKSQGWYTWYSNPSDAWYQVNLKTREALIRTQRRFGIKLQIKSMFRSRPYNDYIRELRKKAGDPPGKNGNYGVAFNSKHIDGMAFDITWVGFNRTSVNTFLDIAEEEGFLARVPYFGDGFVHIDTHSKRTWVGN